MAVIPRTVIIFFMCALNGLILVLIIFSHFLNDISGMQHIIHKSEQPEYKMNYFIPVLKGITAKVYVIDSETYSTMLLAEEY